MLTVCCAAVVATRRFRVRRGADPTVLRKATCHAFALDEHSAVPSFLDCPERQLAEGRAFLDRLPVNAADREKIAPSGCSAFRSGRDKASRGGSRVDPFERNLL